MSKAAVSTIIRNLIRESVVTTDVDSSKRPPMTVYKINPLTPLFRTAGPLYSIQEEEEPEYRIYDMQLAGKRVVKDLKLLEQLLRLHVIKEICDQSRTFAVVSTEDYIDLGLPKLIKYPFESEQDVQDSFIESIITGVKYIFESGYGIKLPGDIVGNEIQKMRQQGFFDIGLKHHYGIRVAKKLAQLHENWIQEMVNFYDKIEKEGM